MKIDREKLNTLLKSGLNQDIKTRKQLAAFLNLDPTSLTRWFATTDRLGNPRYPVVPDRHVTKLLTLFNLTTECLRLNDEDFRQHCFELSLLRTQADSEAQDEFAQKSVRRLEQAAKRKLTLHDYPKVKNGKIYRFVMLLLVVVNIGWLSSNVDISDVWKSSKTMSITPSNEGNCWQGYSSALGDFTQPDNADPCHYGKLFHNALLQLKARNENKDVSHTGQEFASSENYIKFLSQQLDQRRIKDSIVLYIELGKGELARSNYQAALDYFLLANDLVDTSVTPETELKAKIAVFTVKAKAKLN